MVIRIVGKGPVALACGLLMLRQGIAAARIELDTDTTPLPPALAARTLALSAGSWQLLSRITDLTGLPMAAPIETIDVSLQGRAGRVHLTASELKVPALGYVVRYGELSRRLLAAAGKAGFAAPMALGQTRALLVHAEGDTGEQAREREFDQSAIIAEVSVPGAHPATAYERFTGQGPLALLPLPETGRYALVWCCRPDEADRRMSLDDAAFLAELADLLAPALQPRQVVGTRHHTQLRRRHRPETVERDAVWIGNAAQALHPVAGQGFNLGLRDAFVLARELGSREFPVAHGGRGDFVSHHAFSHAGAAPIETAPEWAAALARYRQARHQDRQASILVTDLLARIFTVRPLQAIESVALAALDLSTRGRRLVARQMMFGQR